MRKPDRCVKFFLIAAMLGFGTLSFGQTDTTGIRAAMVQLDAALLKKDTATIGRLLHRDVLFGHSNGWTETKEDVLKDVAGGYLVYDQLASDNIRVNTAAKLVLVRMKVAAKGKVNNKDFDLSLHVLQVWQKHKNNWQLVARQSTKLNN